MIQLSSILSTIKQKNVKQPDYEYSDLTVTIKNLRVADHKEFIAIHFSQPGAQGYKCAIRTLDLKGDLYIFSYWDFLPATYIPLEALLSRYFPFLRNWEFVSMSGVDLFHRWLKGEEIKQESDIDCGWVAHYIGCGNYLAILS